MSYSTTVSVCVWYSSRVDGGTRATPAGPRSLTTRPTTTRPYIIKRGGGSGGSGGGGGASALARAAAGAGGNAEGGGGGRWWGWGGGGALAGVRVMKVWRVGWRRLLGRLHGWHWHGSTCSLVPVPRTPSASHGHASRTRVPAPTSDCDPPRQKGPHALVVPCRCGGTGNQACTHNDPWRLTRAYQPRFQAQ